MFQLYPGMKFAVAQIVAQVVDVAGLDAIVDAIVVAVQDGTLERQVLLDAAAKVRQLAVATHGVDHEHK